jgi:hypothetical protein
MRKKTG